MSFPTWSDLEDAAMWPAWKTSLLPTLGSQTWARAMGFGDG